MEERYIKLENNVEIFDKTCWSVDLGFCSARGKKHVKKNI